MGIFDPAPPICGRQVQYFVTDMLFRERNECFCNVYFVSLLSLSVLPDRNLAFSILLLTLVDTSL